MNVLRTLSYKSLHQSEDGTDESTPMSQRSAIICSYIGWIFASVFAFSTAFLLFHSSQMTDHHTAGSAGSFGTGFSTEFDPIKPHIREQSTMFWGSTSVEIDSAWKKLLKYRYFTITEEEAELTFGKPHGLYNHPDGIGYQIGLDVLHTLHCVEQLRKALDRDHYFNKETKLAYPDRGHRDHCLDHIRQQLMCHADLTPIPVIWYEGHGRSFVQSDVVHTCRNWEAVQQFISSRAD